MDYFDFEEIFLNSPTATMILSEKCRVLKINKAMEELTEYSLEELKEKKIYKLFFSNKESLIIEENLKENLVFECDLKQKSNSFVRTKIRKRTFKTNEKKYFILTIHDISSYRNAEKFLKEKMVFEKLLLEMSNEFIELESSQIDIAINKWIKKTGVLLGSDRNVIYKLKNGRFYFDDFWQETENISQMNYYDPEELFPWIAERIRHGKVMIVNSIQDDIPDGIIDKQNLPKINIKSFILVPLKIENKVVGAFSFGYQKQEKKWEQEFVSKIEFLAQIFAAALLRKENDENLKKSEQRYKELAEMLPEAIWEFDEKGNFTYVNKAAVKYFGYTKEEFLKKNIFEYEMIAPKDKTRAINALKTRLSTKRSEQLDQYTALRKDGSTFESLISISPLVKNGVFLGGKGLLIDVSEQVKIRQKLYEEKERLLVTLKSIGDGVIVVDKNERVILLNKKAEEITEWTQEDAEQCDFSDIFNIFNEKTNTQMESPAKTVLKTGKTLNLSNNAVLISKSGNKKNIADSASPIKNEDGEILGVVIVFRDVTFAKKQEEELLRLRNLESVGRLAGGIAHDFNNILTGIMGNIELAQIKTQTIKDVQKYFKRALSGIKRASTLSNKLLTFSKGGNPIKTTASIEEIIKETAEFILHGKSVKLEMFFDKDLKNVEVDKEQIAQVVQNLIINAQQSIDKNGIITVTCKNFRDKSNKDFVKIEFKDTGKGISKENLDKIFEPYFTTKKTGNGLGLAIIHSIIEKHHGKISVESTLGKGTTFIILLPATEKKLLKTYSSLSKQGHIEQSKKHKILIMDDQDIILDSMSAVLQEFNFETFVAKNGNEVLEIYKKTPFDLAVLDITIPGGMGGVETLSELKKLNPKIKAIVSSGYSKDSALSNALKLGFSDILEKPYKIQELISKINSLLHS